MQRRSHLEDDSSYPPQNVHYIILFNVFYILGLLSLSVIMLTVWRSTRIQRASTWFMFILSWMFTSLANLIIIGQQIGPMPMYGVCLFQAIFEYGLPVFSSLYAVAFMLQVYFSIFNAIHSESTLSKRRLLFIHALPWTALIGILTEALVLGLLYPDSIERNPSGMYCHLTLQLPSQITAAITIGAMIFFMILGGRVLLMLRRTWKASSHHQFLRHQTYMSPDIVTRVIIFSFCPVIALSISLLQYLQGFRGADATSKINLVLAVLPLVAGLIFGTQRDILKAWMICRSRRKGAIEDVTA